MLEHFDQQKGGGGTKLISAKNAPNLVRDFPRHWWLTIQGTGYYPRDPRTRNARPHSSPGVVREEKAPDLLLVGPLGHLPRPGEGRGQQKTGRKRHHGHTGGQEVPRARTMPRKEPGSDPVSQMGPAARLPTTPSKLSWPGSEPLVRDDRANRVGPCTNDARVNRGAARATQNTHQTIEYPSLCFDRHASISRRRAAHQPNVYTVNAAR